MDQGAWIVNLADTNAWSAGLSTKGPVDISVAQQFFFNDCGSFMRDFGDIVADSSLRTKSLRISQRCVLKWISQS
jgi:hypothetical protein